LRPGPLPFMVPFTNTIQSKQSPALFKTGALEIEQASFPRIPDWLGVVSWSCPPRLHFGSQRLKCRSCASLSTVLPQLLPPLLSTLFGFTDLAPPLFKVGGPRPAFSRNSSFSPPRLMGSRSFLPSRMTSKPPPFFLLYFLFITQFPFSSAPPPFPFLGFAPSPPVRPRSIQRAALVCLSRGSFFTHGEMPHSFTLLPAEAFVSPPRLSSGCPSFAFRDSLNLAVLMQSVHFILPLTRAFLSPLRPKTSLIRGVGAHNERDRALII